MDFMIPKKENLILSDGEYVVQIGSIELLEGRSNMKVLFNFNFNIGKSKGPGVTNYVLSGQTPYIYSENSKLFKWTEAAMGDEFLRNADFYSERLIGRRVILKISKRLNKKGFEINRVEDILPMPINLKKALAPRS